MSRTRAAPTRIHASASRTRTAAGGVRVAVLPLVLGSVLVAGVSCRPLPPPDTDRDRPAEAGGEAARGPDREIRTPPTASSRDSISPEVAAIIDSIEAAVRDSFARLARQDSIAETARQDSIEAAQRDSVAAAARRDSIEAARRDSIAAAARRDSIAAVARLDSLRAAARQDSIAAARRDSITAAARRDSIEARTRRDSLAAAARRDSIEAAVLDSIARARAAEREPPPDDLETLRELGPAFIPYDEGPQTIWNTETQATLAKILLPVLREEELPARTRTAFWVLITREGDVDRLVVQTSSGSEAFDEAAAEFARTLVFIPAIRANRPVAAWVLREISLLMQ